MEDIKVLEILEYYDQPLLVLASASNRVLLGVLIDDSETETWLYAPVSEQRLEKIKAREIDLHDVFSDVEGGILYKVFLPDETMKAVKALEVSDDDLPGHAYL